MKLLHTSDLHLGKRVNGFSMLADQRFILDRILSVCSERAVDALLIAGDIYDKVAPSAEAVALFDAFLTRLADAGVRVLAIPGNHDSAERVSFAQSLLAAQGVWFAPVFDGTVEKVVLSDEYGEVAFWLVPYLRPGSVRRFFPEAGIADDYAAALEAVLASCGVEAFGRNVVLSHQLVTAGSWGPERADDEVQLGGVDNVDVSVYDAFDYVALGHVHRPQRVGRDTVRYSGSPLKYSFSEARYAKSAVLVELGPKAAGQEPGACVGTELVELVPLHDMRELHTSLAEAVEAGLGAEAGREDYLRVVLTDEFPPLDALAKLRDVYPNVMACEQGVAGGMRLAPDGPEAVDPDDVDMLDLFDGFYEEQTGKAMDGQQRALVERLAHEAEEAAAHGADDGKGCVL